MTKFYWVFSSRYFSSPPETCIVTTTTLIPLLFISHLDKSGNQLMCFLVCILQIHSQYSCPEAQSKNKYLTMTFIHSLKYLQRFPIHWSDPSSCLNYQSAFCILLQHLRSPCSVWFYISSVLNSFIVTPLVSCILVLVWNIIFLSSSPFFASLTFYAERLVSRSSDSSFRKSFLSTFHVLGPYVYCQIIDDFIQIIYLHAILRPVNSKP